MFASVRFEELITRAGLWNQQARGIGIISLNHGIRVAVPLQVIDIYYELCMQMHKVHSRINSCTWTRK